MKSVILLYQRQALMPTKITVEDSRRYREDPMEFFRELTIPTATGNWQFGNVWATFQREFFEAISPNLLAMSAGEHGPYRGFWLERTKGASKDSDVGCCLLWLLLFSRRRLSMEAGADDQPQILETHDAMNEMAAQNPWILDRLGFFRTRVDCESSRSRLRFLTADRKEGKRKHGSRPDVTLCNEVSHVENKGFILTMLDNADKVPTNLRIMATNAGEIRSWQYEWRERYRRSESWFFQKVSRPAPWVDGRVLKDASLRSTTQRYERLWKGVWVSGDSEALDTRDVKACMSRARKPMMGNEDGYLFLLGLDLGIKHDHAALVTLGARLGSGKVRLATCRSWKPDSETGVVDLREVREAVKEEYKAFRHVWMGYDPFQAELMAQDLRHAGLPMNELTFTPKNCDQMARDILASFRSRVLELYEDWDLIEDLHRLSIKEKKHGYQKLEATSDERGHADRATAFAIALPLSLVFAKYEVEDDGVPDDFGMYDAAFS